MSKSTPLTCQLQPFHAPLSPHHQSGDPARCMCIVEVNLHHHLCRLYPSNNTPLQPNNTKSTLFPQVFPVAGTVQNAAAHSKILIKKEGFLGWFFRHHRYCYPQQRL